MNDMHKNKNQEKLYFVSFSIVAWIDVFTSPTYKEILLESLRHCRAKKGLQIHAWCFMTNHVHLIVSNHSNERLEDILRDLKKYTSIRIVREIESNPEEQRKKWLLWMFKKIAQKTNRHQKHCFWQDSHLPIELYNNAIMEQKLNQMHEHPVQEGIVSNPEDYMYSSAIDYTGRKGLLDIKIIERVNHET